MKRVAVIGAGTMGNGIAHVFSQHDINVTLIDIQQELLDQAITIIRKNMERELRKEKITSEQMSAAISNITTSTSISDAADWDFVIEAASEELTLKLNIFQQLDRICRSEVILATNTSSISITKIAAATSRPDKVIGMHFMNPVPVMKLVEAIRGVATSESTYITVEQLAKKLNKVPVEVNDYPGFVANRILMPMINEAIYALFDGVASVEAIDTIMKLGMSHPMGPLTLADFIGLDVCLAILEVMHEDLGFSKYNPCVLLRKMVEAGYYGKKSGRGFYDYTDPKNPKPSVHTGCTFK